jgi:hypothetical protein
VKRALVLFASLLVFAGLLGLTGCRGRGTGDDLGLSVSLDFAPTPPVVGANPVLLTLKTPDGEPVTDASVRLEGTMSHAGMRPVFSDTEEIGEGRYRAPAFEFTMGGDWILFLHVTLPDGREGRLERRVRVVSGPPGSEGEAP